MRFVLHQSLAEAAEAVLPWDSWSPLFIVVQDLNGQAMLRADQPSQGLPALTGRIWGPGPGLLPFRVAAIDTPGMRLDSGCSKQKYSVS